MRIINTIIGIILAFSLPHSARADVLLPATSDAFIYVFHFYYDQGALVVDRDAKFPYNILKESFRPTDVGEEFYTGKIISLNEKVLAEFRFNQSQALVSKKSGVFSTNGPYFANAARADFYKDSAKILSINLAASSFCNDDKVCNKDVGENYQNCISDCPAPKSQPATSLQSASRETNIPVDIGTFGAVPKDDNSALSTIIFILFGVVFAAGAYVIYRRQRSQ